MTWGVYPYPSFNELFRVSLNNRATLTGPFERPESGAFPLTLSLPKGRLAMNGVPRIIERTSEKVRDLGVYPYPSFLRRQEPRSLTF